MKTHRQIFCYNEKIGHLFVPNLNARVMNENGGYYVRTNSMGFRSDTEFETKKTGKPRILFFGDSNTAADGVSNSERFSDLVGKHFDAEVYNFGLSGSGTDQQYLVWREFAQDIEADLVVVGVLVENIERNKVAYRETLNPFTRERVLTPKPYFKLQDGKLKLSNFPVPRVNGNSTGIKPEMVQWEIPRGQEALYKLHDGFRKSKLLGSIRSSLGPQLVRLRSLLIKMAYQPHPDYQETGSDGYSIMKEILTEFVDSLAPVPVMVMPIPTYHYYADGAKPVFKQFFQNFEDPGKQVHVANLPDDLNKLEYDKRRELCFREDKSHFSQRGHQIISRFLIDEIEKHGILSHQSSSYRVAESNGKAEKPLYILGISAFYHDSAAALIKDGEIVAAAQEERFSRVKNDRRFPLSAINFCLERGNIQQDDLSAIVYYDKTSLTLERLLWTFSKTAPASENAWKSSLPSWVKYKLFLPRLIRKKLKYSGKILQDFHHRSHCAAAFYPSPFRKAAILTVDGVGEWATASIALGDENKVTMLKEMLFPNSLGLIYSAFTQFTGFKVNSGEYKMMGLAPYGSPIYVDTILENLVDLKDDGSIDVNQEYFSYMDGSVMTNERFAELFGGPARLPETKISKREMDIACSIQKVTEEVILRMARHARELTGAEYLCMAGGVALNCVANGRLLKENIFKDVWIQPAAGDAGSALGAALDAHYMYFEKRRMLPDDGRPLQRGSYWGPEWNNDEIKSFLDTENIKYREIQDKNRDAIIAGLLDEGKVVGHYSGRTEFGPRALGARSIIGDARSQEMQTTINLKIKYRESFRPFAPTVLADRVDEYFELDKESPYMLFVAPVREDRRLPFERGTTDEMLEIVRQPRSDVPAITHVDYSARVQTIDKEDHGNYYNLIRAFQESTGYGIIVNTSFNVRGEPIVNSPMDAYRCFMNTEMDVLVLENCMLFKEEQEKMKTAPKETAESQPGTNANKDEALEKSLSSLYQKKVLPASGELGNEVPGESGSCSRWIDCVGQNEPDSIFDISDDLDHPKPDPDKMAGTITRGWYNRRFADIFEPVVVRLISLGSQYPLEEDMTGSVSSKMYEMF